MPEEGSLRQMCCGSSPFFRGLTLATFLALLPSIKEKLINYTLFQIVRTHWSLHHAHQGMKLRWPK